MQEEAGTGGEKQRKTRPLGGPRQPLPSERDAHSQQWGLGVVVLDVLHNRLQVLSVAGAVRPGGLRASRLEGSEAGAPRAEISKGSWRWALTSSSSPRQPLLLKTTALKHTRAWLGQAWLEIQGPTALPKARALSPPGSG